MQWPGTGDSNKRRKTIRFLIILLIIGVTVGVGSSIIQGWLGQSDPLKVCIQDRNTPYKISATLELYIDGNKAVIPGNIGFEVGEVVGVKSECQHSLYTLTDDGTIYAEWEEEYPFEIGHFLWTWTNYHAQGFPMKDMNDSETRVMVNGKETDEGIHALLKHGSVYRAEFYSEGFDQSQESDFLPPDL